LIVRQQDRIVAAIRDPRNPGDPRDARKQQSGVKRPEKNIFSPNRSFAKIPDSGMLLSDVLLT